MCNECDKNLESLAYKVCFVTVINFSVFGSFLIILGVSVITVKTVCCYAVMTSEVGLYLNPKMLSFVEICINKYNILVETLAN